MPELKIDDQTALELIEFCYSTNRPAGEVLEAFKSSRTRREVILVTADGVEVTEPTALWIVSENWNLSQIIKVSKASEVDFPHNGVFMSKTRAELFILESRPRCQ